MNKTKSGLLLGV